jgi:hypothetical protein
MPRIGRRFAEGDPSTEEALTAALTEAIGTVVEQLGSPVRPIDLLVTVRSDRVSVSEAPARGAQPASFASWLKLRLEDRGLSKVGLAGRLGVSERTVRRWLAGQTEPRFQELVKISGLLGNSPV